MEGVPPVSNEEVIRVFSENNSKVKSLIYGVIPRLPAERTCPCAVALQGAEF